MGPPWGAFCQITLTSCYINQNGHVVRSNDSNEQQKQTKPLQGRDNDTKRRAVYLRQLTFLLVNISVIISIIVVKVIAHNDAYLC